MLMRKCLQRRPGWGGAIHSGSDIASPGNETAIYFTRVFKIVLHLRSISSATPSMIPWDPAGMAVIEKGCLTGTLKGVPSPYWT